MKIVLEADFLPVSFGFRPKRSAHDALQVLIDEFRREGRWVVDTDIANCFRRFRMRPELGHISAQGQASPDCRSEHAYQPGPSPGHDSAVTERQIATHTEPARRDDANFIVRLDLTEHGMAGKYEQMWTRTQDQHSFELCCIPFFTYGQSIGDVLQVTVGTGQHRVLAKSGHRTVRFSFTDDKQAHEQHQALHGALVGELGCRVEFNGVHYGAIDLAPDVSADQVIDVLRAHHDAGYLIWEWADPARPTNE